ncbi:ATP-dependent DNA helicase RecG [Nitrosococcus halophilus Nc 4]|uniref:ATP-dependent DNA helicase RecG n=1 Tax=Nitrosococcus halophilus (strain Nc4) TaxID=472759 RepID=D5BXI2_NITHN|nr:ATP-dependent DNA helicase RecG [Nitrosococcus halophilus]ADE13940.1 ATP-dependent DNA helicase RecG [Nitrosococcus halophilus Nc 4]
MPLSILATEKPSLTQEQGDPNPLTLSTPVTALKGVGPNLARRLARLGLSKVQDLLFHLPQRYQDRTQLVPIGALQIGREALIEGEIQLSEIRQGRRRSLVCAVSDGTGEIFLRFFHFSTWQQNSLTPAIRLRCFGEVRQGAGRLEMVHPEYRRLLGEEAEAIEVHLTPIYPTTEGLRQPLLRDLIQGVLKDLGEEGIIDHLPPTFLEGIGLPTLSQAIVYLHQPPPDAPLDVLAEGKHPVQQRLAFEELLAHHLSLRQLRLRATQLQAPSLASEGQLQKRFLAALSFPLTAAQERVVQEILEDMARDSPMQRLLQGDVGSGKTVVAALAILQAVEAGHQAALMAPTELLAEQHLRVLQRWFSPFEINVEWLAAKGAAKGRRESLNRLKSGEAQVAVGTHALFQEGVNFHHLGLVVVDEQHRFGVEQRLALREKGRHGAYCPHQLIMTATPIPRTLAMTAYADLDTSVIDQLPPGRIPVATAAVSHRRRTEVVVKVRRACQAGRQAYWVCTLIEESDSLQAQAAEKTAAELAEVLPELRIGLIHGRMKPPDKESTMAAFKSGAIHLLVATTVIEVGVDVPNASLMIIENAERLGLSQLHQLRGRVGRGAADSYCVLLYHGPLSELSRARLACLRATNDGFEIARRDLELRGPGEVLGTRQTGLPQYRVADLLRDQDLLARVGRVADRFQRQYPAQAEALIRRWLGEESHYGEV